MKELQTNFITQEQIEEVLKSVNHGSEDNPKYTIEDIKLDTTSKPIRCYLIKENYLSQKYPLILFGEWDGSHFYSHHVSSSRDGMQQIVPHEQDNVLGYIEYKTE